MIYQVRANFFFSQEDEARDFFHDCEIAWPKTTDINENTPAAEISIAELIENHHDDNPNASCRIIKTMPSL